MNVYFDEMHIPFDEPRKSFDETKLDIPKQLTTKIICNHIIIYYVNILSSV